MEMAKSQEHNSLSSVHVERLSVAEQCPVCGGDNQCRMAKGHLYKGACWCVEIIVSSHILSSFVTDRFEPACLCRPCLETLEKRKLISCRFLTSWTNCADAKHDAL
jgi:Cysteine-rich CWC